MTDIVLTDAEARVLGCLVEKALTVPDSYPLSLNSLRLACNQTTNRDPIVHYDDAVVEDALDSLRTKGLAGRSKGHGERAIKHRHFIEDVLGVDHAQRAVLTALMLRGPQTAGELKTRTERMHRFADPHAVETTLQELRERDFVVLLGRRPGQKEARWVQTLTPLSEAAAAEGAGAEPTALATPAPVVRIETSLAVKNPATGATVRSLAVDDETEIVAKLTRARAAQREWARRPFADRAAALGAFADALAAGVDAAADVMTAETGKPIAHSRNEVRAAVDRVRWYVEHAARVIAPLDVTPAGATRERVTYEPRGVVAHISAWNYPYFVGLNSIVPALLCGNAVLYKPSEYATLTGLHIVDVLRQCGVPHDVIAPIVGSGATGAALVTSGVDLVCFTGSYPTGRRIAAAAGERLVPVQLELGGKDAAYVCDDVDVATTAANVAEGCYYHAGQSCCAIERVYVHERVWEPFVAAFVEAARAWTLGDPADDATQLGVLARPQHVAFLQAQVDDATARGARLLLGGELDAQRPGAYPATVLVDVDHTMRVMREETFGPVIGLMRVRDDEQAVELMDDSEYGLTAAVFTRDEARAERILERLDVGTAYWNCADRTSVTLPWAGRRNSGLGSSMAESGIRAFVREKAWHLRG